MQGEREKQRRDRAADRKSAAVASKRMAVVAYSTRVWKLKRTVWRG